MIEYIIKLIHLLIVLIVLVSPFINNALIKKNVIFLLIYIIFRNITGYKNCGLTKLESKFSNKPLDTGFIYKIISPFSNVKKYDFYKLIVPIQYWILFSLLFQKFNN